MSVLGSLRSNATGASADGAPSVRFSEATKQLAKAYYPFIYVDKRRLSKPVVDLQAALEVCSDSLDEFEKLTADINSIQYALYGLEQALGRAISELIVIRDEIAELMTTLKESERFNLRLFDQLISLDKCMQEGIESGRASITKSKSIRNAPPSNIEKYRIPKITKEALEMTLISPEPSAMPSSQTAGLLGGQPTDESRLVWLVKIQRELSHRHAEFSFLAIGLWTEGVYENHELLTNEPTGCFRRSKSREEDDENESRGLLLAHKGKIDDTSATVGTIATRVQELGTRIFEELGRLKKNYEDVKTQHKDLTAELADRRRQLVESLLATHRAVQTLLELDEQNDALVGKLIKTRPLFSELHQALVRGELDVTDGDENGGNFQLLPDMLGPEGWSQLLDNLGSAQPQQPPTEAETNQNSKFEEEHDGENSTFSTKFLNHARRTYVNTRKQLRRSQKS